MIINVKRIVNILYEVSVFFLLFQQMLFPSELTFITLLFNIICGCIIVMFNGKLKWNPFIITYMFFLLLISILTFNNNSDFEALKTLILYLMQILSSIGLFNYIVFTNNHTKFIKVYIYTATISMILIILLLGSNVIVSRFGHNGSGAIVSYYLLGNPIYKSSNGTANVCAIATLLLFYLKSCNNKKIYNVLIIFLGICMLFCGSRKGFIIYFIYIVYVLFLLKKGINIKKILLIFIFPILCYIVFFKVPVFYRTVGYRIDSLVKNILSVENKIDGNSYLERKRLKERAYMAISEKPWFGHGIGYMVKYAGNGAENNILQIAVDFGIVAAIVYYLFLPFLIVDVVKNYRRSKICAIFSVIVLTIVLQDYASVTFSWQSMTMWYSIFWGIIRNKNTSDLTNEKINNFEHQYLNVKELKT